MFQHYVIHFKLTRHLQVSVLIVRKSFKPRNAQNILFHFSFMSNSQITKVRKTTTTTTTTTTATTMAMMIIIIIAIMGEALIIIVVIKGFLMMIIFMVIVMVIADISDQTIQHVLVKNFSVFLISTHNHNLDLMKGQEETR